MRNEPVTRMVDQDEKPMVLAEMALRAKATALKRSLSQPRLVAAPKPPGHSRSQKGEGIRMPEERLESQRERGTTASPVSVSGILQSFGGWNTVFLGGKRGSSKTKNILVRVNRSMRSLHFSTYRIHVLQYIYLPNLSKCVLYFTYQA